MSILAALSMGTIKNPEVMFGDLMMIAIKWRGHKIRIELSM